MARHGRYLKQRKVRNNSFVKYRRVAFDAIILIALLIAIFDIRLERRNFLIGFAAAASMIRLGESYSDLKKK